MAQEQVWENEYRNSKLVTKDDKPQNDTLDFFKYLKREKGVLLSNDLPRTRALDLGCGTGRNSNYMALEGAIVTGMEISSTALRLALERAKELGLAEEGVGGTDKSTGSVDYIKGNIGEILEFENNSFDILIDVTSSNSLNETERERYIQESHRVLKSGGNFFVKALCKDGDHNAKNLLKLSPGKEPDTYIMPEIGLVERVWSKEDFVAYYSRYFVIEKLEKKTSYSRFNGQSYKRNFWLAYMSKR